MQHFCMMQFKWGNRACRDHQIKINTHDIATMNCRTRWCAYRWCSLREHPRYAIENWNSYDACNHFFYLYYKKMEVLWNGIRITIYLKVLKIALFSIYDGFFLQLFLLYFSGNYLWDQSSYFSASNSKLWAWFLKNFTIIK